MITELITIGDEVMTGHTVDTNAAFLARTLTDAGHEIRFRTSVGDTVDLMVDAFKLAMSRAELIVTTGGLGPTDDDLTKRAIARQFKRNLIFHDDILRQIEQRFAARGMTMGKLNQNQALLPQGATLLPNRIGSAVGIVIEEEQKLFVSLPGVPREMEILLQEELMPFLAKRKGTGTTAIRKLRTIGIAESHLAELIAPHYKAEAGVRLAYLPSYSGVDLRLVATAPTAVDSAEKINRIVDKLRPVIAPYLFGVDSETIEQAVGALLKGRSATLSVAESCSGGQLGMAITSVAGSSDWFVGGIVSYDNRIKIEQLGVPAELITQHGAVSEEVACAMAAGVRARFGTTHALSITGIAGPDGGTDEKPVGTVWIGLSDPSGTSASLSRFGSDRQVNRTRSVYAALNLLRKRLTESV